MIQIVQSAYTIMSQNTASIAGACSNDLGRFNIFGRSCCLYCPTTFCHPVYREAWHRYISFAYPGTSCTGNGATRWASEISIPRIDRLSHIGNYDFRGNREAVRSLMVRTFGTRETLRFGCLPGTYPTPGPEPVEGVRTVIITIAITAA